MIERCGGEVEDEKGRNREDKKRKGKTEWFANGEREKNKGSLMKGLFFSLGIHWKRKNEGFYI